MTRDDRDSAYEIDPAYDAEAERLVDAHADDSERALEGALRPRRLDEFIGQSRVCAQLDVVLQAARRRERPSDHVLMSGPPGLGKTTLATIIARELDAPLRITSGPAVQHAGDLAAILSSLQPGEVLFLDEIHRTARPAEEMLYLAMEDFRVDVVIGKGPGATAVPLELPPFTLVAATTRAGLITTPLRDRFGIPLRLNFYEPDELEAIVRRAATLLALDLAADGAAEIARRARGTPRVANRLLRRVRDFAQVRAGGHISRDVARDALAMLDVDEFGLDEMDTRVLRAIIEKFDGGPVGVATIAAAVGEEPDTLEEVYEPFLVQHGFLQRTPRGRVATSQAYRHLGYPPPSTPQADLF